LWIRATTSDCRTVRTPYMCRTYVCSATTKPVFLSALQNVLPHVGVCEHKIKVEWWRQVHLPGQSGTRLTAYHISRHVASTFKSLATTTKHFGLKTFHRNRQGKLPGHDTIHDPVRHPYSGCNNVNIQLLYRASDRKSPDFYRSY
jgi:hypothetical protein